MNPEEFHAELHEVAKRARARHGAPSDGAPPYDPQFAGLIGRLVAGGQVAEASAAMVGLLPGPKTPRRHARIDVDQLVGELRRAAGAEAGWLDAGGEPLRAELATDVEDCQNESLEQQAAKRQRRAAGRERSRALLKEARSEELSAELRAMQRNVVNRREEPMHRGRPARPVDRRY